MIDYIALRPLSTCLVSPRKGSLSMFRFIFVVLFACLATISISSAEVIDNNVVCQLPNSSSLDDTLDQQVMAFDVLVGDYDDQDSTVYVAWTSFQGDNDQTVVAAYRNGEELWRTIVPFPGDAYPIAVKMVGGRVIVCSQTVSSNPFETQLSIAAIANFNGGFLYYGHVTPSYSASLPWQFEMYTAPNDLLIDTAVVIWHVQGSGSSYFQRVNVAENPPTLFDGDGTAFPNGCYVNSDAAWQGGRWWFSDCGTTMYSISPTEGLVGIDTTSSNYWTMFSGSEDSLWGVTFNNGMVLEHLSTSGEVNPIDTRVLLSLHTDPDWSFRMSHERFITGGRFLTTSMIEDTPWPWYHVSVGWYDLETGGNWGFSLPTYNPPISHAGAISDHMIGLITAGQTTVRFDAWDILDSAYTISVDSIGPHQDGWGGWSRIFPDGHGGAELFWTTAEGMGPGTLYHYHVTNVQSTNNPIQTNIPIDMSLGQNYPNPFNPTTTIPFNLHRAGPVTLKVFNITGQLVATVLNNQVMSAGQQQVNFDGSQLSSGVYVYTISSGNFQAAQKMVLMK